MGAVVAQHMVKLVHADEIAMNNVLSDGLMKRIRGGEVRTVRQAASFELCGFEPERSKCHENVIRWCKINPHHLRARGWIISGTYVLDKHSVVDRREDGLLEITPLPDRLETSFLPHDGTAEEFDALPNQVIAFEASV
jgi:hypothetical protein